MSPLPQPAVDAARPDVWIGAGLATLGATTTTGWLMHLPRLVQIVPGLLPMVFNTGLCFLGIGVALVLGPRVSSRARHVRTLVAALAMALCVATVFEIALDRPLGIDFASLHAWFDYSNTRPGRMAPNTALGFILAASALLLAERVRRRTAAVAVVALTFGLLAVGLTGLVGYLLAPDLLFGWARSARMALHTATGMILAALGIWLSWSRRPWYVGEVHFRDDAKIRLLSAVIVVIVTITAGLSGFVLQQRGFEQTLENRLEDAVGARTARFREATQQYRDRASLDIVLTGAVTSAGQWSDAVGNEARKLELLRDTGRLLSAGYRSVAIERADGSVAARYGAAARTPAFLAPIDSSGDIELAWDGELVLRTRHVAGTTGTSLVLERPVPDISRLLSDTARLGDSAEVATCILRGAKLLCLPNRRNAATYMVPPRGGTAPLPMERALAGSHAIAYAVDYRGRSVVAAVGQLAPGIGLVVKQDTIDAYAPIRHALSLGTPIILLATLLGGVLMAWQLSPLVGRLRRSEQLASEAAAKTAAIMHAAGDAIVTIDHLGRMLAANEAAHRTFGYGDGELIGQNVSMLMPASSRAGHTHGLARVVAGGAPRLVGTPNVQVSGLHCDGTEFPLELTLSAVPLEGHPMFVGVMRDVSERRALEQKLSHMAQFDNLTGLPNRALFMDRLDTAMARAVRSHRAFAVMFLDLDGFKAVNDTWGHGAGDEVLVQVAGRLATAVRRTDTVARLGGDEFTILLEELTLPEEDSQAIAEKVMEVLRQPILASGQPVRVTASIGLVLHRSGSHLSAASELLSRADSAMYEAKRAGKDGCRTLADA